MKKGILLSLILLHISLCSIGGTVGYRVLGGQPEVRFFLGKNTFEANPFGFNYRIFWEGGRLTDSESEYKSWQNGLSFGFLNGGGFNHNIFSPSTLYNIGVKGDTYWHVLSVGITTDFGRIKKSNTQQKSSFIAVGSEVKFASDLFGFSKSWGLAGGYGYSISYAGYYVLNKNQLVEDSPLTGAGHYHRFSIGFCIKIGLNDEK